MFYKIKQKYYEIFANENRIKINGRVLFSIFVVMLTFGLILNSLFLQNNSIEIYVNGELVDTIGYLTE